MDFWNSANSLRRLLTGCRSYPFWLVLLFAGFICSASAQESSSQQPSQNAPRGKPAASSADKPLEIDAAMIDEIIAIRNQLGGGLGKTLSGLTLDGGGPTAKSGTIGDSSHAAEFADALAGLDSDKQPLILDPSHGGDKQQTLAILPINGILAVEASLGGQQEFIDYRSPMLQKSQKTRHCLRHVARQLDQLAADLEDVQQYQQADDLRKTATNIRQQVRIAESASSETTDLRR